MGRPAGVGLHDADALLAHDVIEPGNQAFADALVIVHRVDAHVLEHDGLVAAEFAFNDAGQQVTGHAAFGIDADLDVVGGIGQSGIDALGEIAAARPADVLAVDFDDLVEVFGLQGARGMRTRHRQVSVVLLALPDGDMVHRGAGLAVSNGR